MNTLTQCNRSYYVDMNKNWRFHRRASTHVKDVGNARFPAVHSKDRY